MRDTDYAFAVARIRANEARLLDSHAMDQLVQAGSVRDVLRMLSDFGWDVPETGADTAAILDSAMVDTWALLQECAPKGAKLDALIVENDFFNLKGAYKAQYSGEDLRQYMMTPCLVEPDTIVQAVQLNTPELLPIWMQQAARQMYEAVFRLENGRLADLYCDRETLQTRIAFAQESDSKLLKLIAQASAALANLKIALRGTASGKRKESLLDVMCRCQGIDNVVLLDAAADGVETLVQYLDKTILNEVAQSLPAGLTMFEKACDDWMLALLRQAKFVAFGPDPLVAYYYACNTQVKNVRIILAAKENDLPPEEIQKRMRVSYV